MNVEELEAKTIEFYPNPASRYAPLNITNLPVDAHVQMVDITGRTHQVEVNNDQINVADLTAGIYFVQVLVNDAIVTTKKIVLN